MPPEPAPPAEGQAGAAGRTAGATAASNLDAYPVYCAASSAVGM
jgi:hypothetical protein